MGARIRSTTWKDRIRVGLKSDYMDLSFSIPLASLGEWEAASFIVKKIKDRFINGSARCQISIKDGTPKLSFSKLTLNHRELEDMPRGHAAEWVSGAIAELAKEDTSNLSLIQI